MKVKRSMGKEYFICRGDEMVKWAFIIVSSVYYNE